MFCLNELGLLFFQYSFMCVSLRLIANSLSALNFKYFLVRICIFRNMCAATLCTTETAQKSIVRIFINVSLLINTHARFHHSLKKYFMNILSNIETLQVEK